MANHSLNELTKGQRLVTYSILIFIFSFLVLLFALVLSIGPDNRMAGWLLLVAPMVNILVLAVLVVRANRALKAGGYKVTFLGASKASAPPPTPGQ
jgi:hypothetical protein